MSLNSLFHIMIVDDKMKINNKFNLEGVDPNSLKKGIMNHSLSVQISIAFFNKFMKINEEFIFVPMCDIKLVNRGDV